MLGSRRARMWMQTNLNRQGSDSLLNIAAQLVISASSFLKRPLHRANRRSLCFGPQRETSCVDITRIIAMSSTTIRPKFSTELRTWRSWIRKSKLSRNWSTSRSTCTAAVWLSTFFLTFGSGRCQPRVRRIPILINSCGTWEKNQLHQLSARSGFRNSRPWQIWRWTTCILWVLTRMRPSTTSLWWWRDRSWGAPILWVPSSALV